VLFGSQQTQKWNREKQERYETGQSMIRTTIANKNTSPEGTQGINQGNPKRSQHTLVSKKKHSAASVDAVRIIQPHTIQKMIQQQTARATSSNGHADHEHTAAHAHHTPPRPVRQPPTPRIMLSNKEASPSAAAAAFWPRVQGRAGTSYGGPATSHRCPALSRRRRRLRRRRRRLPYHCRNSPK